MSTARQWKCKMVLLVMGYTTACDSAHVGVDGPGVTVTVRDENGDASHTWPATGRGTAKRDVYGNGAPGTYSYLGYEGPILHADDEDDVMGALGPTWAALTKSDDSWREDWWRSSNGGVNAACANGAGPADTDPDAYEGFDERHMTVMTAVTRCEYGFPYDFPLINAGSFVLYTCDELGEGAPTDFGSCAHEPHRTEVDISYEFERIISIHGPAQRSPMSLYGLPE